MNRKPTKKQGPTDAAWDYRRRVIRRSADGNPSLRSCMHEIENAFKAGATWQKRRHTSSGGK